MPHSSHLAGKSVQKFLPLRRVKAVRNSVRPLMEGWLGKSSSRPYFLGGSIFCLQKTLQGWPNFGFDHSLQSPRLNLIAIWVLPWLLRRLVCSTKPISPEGHGMKSSLSLVGHDVASPRKIHVQSHRSCNTWLHSRLGPWQFSRFNALGVAMHGCWLPLESSTGHRQEG